MRLFISSLSIFLFFAIPVFSTFSTDSRSAQVQIITALKNNESQLNTLNERVKYIQDNFYSITQDINSLKQSLAQEKQKNELLEKEITLLKQQLQENKTQNQKLLDDAVKKIAQETSKSVNDALKNVKTQASVPQPTGQSSRDFSSGKFYKYTVQEGATLSTIARAYKVSVDSIRKANNLKSDNISIGQVLLIPKLD